MRDDDIVIFRSHSEINSRSFITNDDKVPDNLSLEKNNDRHNIIITQHYFILNCNIVEYVSISVDAL